jgi:hypothetical protein
MAGTLNAQKALILRITHRDNIPWILKNGLHASSSKVLDPNFRAIGNADLINRRSSRPVKVGPKGMLSNYIPFYFTPFSIMMFNIHTGRNVAPVSNDEIVILVSSLHRIAELDIPFVFTNQHAYPKFASYFTDLADLTEVPWDQLNARDFRHDPDDPGKKERYQAEALIWQHVPTEALLGICCHSAVVNQSIQAEIAKRKLKLTTQVQRGWYFQ